MCSVLYVASDQELHLIPRDETRPAFHIATLRDGERDVRRNFSKPFVYFAGAAEGCSCAFADWIFIDDDAEAAEAHRAEVQPLVSYIESSVRRSSSVELYMCHDGEWANPPRLHRHLGLAEWSREAFRLEEGVLYTVGEDLHA